MCVHYFTFFNTTLNTSVIIINITSSISLALVNTHHHYYWVRIMGQNIINTIIVSTHHRIMSSSSSLAIHMECSLSNIIINGTLSIISYVHHINININTHIISSMVLPSSYHCTSVNKCGEYGHRHRAVISVVCSKIKMPASHTTHILKCFNTP